MDKTEYIRYFIRQENVIFLRPPGFGKSMWLYALKCFFEAPGDCLENKLRISDASYCAVVDGGTKVLRKPDIEMLTFPPCPVLLINFKGFNPTTRLEYNALLGRVLESAFEASFSSRDIGLNAVKPFKLEWNASGLIMLRGLICGLARTSAGSKVVVLVDNYDSCLISHSGTEQQYNEVQEIHREFFALLKSLTSFTVLQCVTGVTRHRMPELFSRGTHLKDISFEPEVATLFGFTQSEAETIATHRGLTKGFVEQMKAQFGGYCFNDAKTDIPLCNPATFRDAAMSGQLILTTPRSTIDSRGIGQDILLRLSLPCHVTLFALRAGEGRSSLLYNAGCLSVKSIRCESSERIIELDYPNDTVRRDVLYAVLRSQDICAVPSPAQSLVSPAWTLANSCYKNLVLALRRRPTPDWISVLQQVNDFESGIQELGCGIKELGYGIKERSEISNANIQFVRRLHAFFHLPHVGLVSS